MSIEAVLAGAILVALTAYVLGAGADFGGGVWDLLAFGPRARAQRDLIAHAIGPIWEANHVWLILVVVLLFVGFPVGFAVITTALHVPLTIMLFGVVLRGSAFAFRSYGPISDARQQQWGRVFAIASLVTPVTLGASVGAIASGAIRVRDGRPDIGFFESWAAPFPAVIGLLALGLFAFLAAVYLTLETDDVDLREDFRRRALAAGVAVGVAAFAGLGLAAGEAPRIYAGLVRHETSLLFQAATGVCAVAALLALWKRRYRAARLLAIVQVVFVLWGWGGSQFPYLVPPDLTFADAAAPAAVLRLLVLALAVGAAVLVPSLVYLFRVFKAGRPSHSPTS